MFKITSFLQNKQYRPYLIASCLLHVVLIGFLISNVSFVNVEKIKVTMPQPDIIKAVAVNHDLVQQEIKRIDKLEEDKKLKEQQRQKQVQNELAKIKQQKELEVKKVEAEKIKAVELKKQQDELAKNALKIKKELAEKQDEKQKLDKELLKKQVNKKQEDLLAKLKKAQEAQLQESLSEEADIIAESQAESQQRRAFVQREIEKYIGLQQAKVSRNWISRDSFLGQSLVTKLEIYLAEDGRVLNVTIVQASGNPALDISAKNAILKASPLPIPSDGNLRRNFTRYRFTFRPDELTS